jgi:hypothetical protein
LRAQDDWVAAAGAYARDHDDARATLNTISGWLTRLFYEPGVEADARRGRAFEGIAEDPTRFPDVVGLGPGAPCDELVRRRFFNED